MISSRRPSVPKGTPFLSRSFFSSRVVPPVLHGLATIGIAPAVVTGVIYPYWWWAHYFFYGADFPPFDPISPWTLAIAPLASIGLVAISGLSFLPFLIASLFALYIATTGAVDSSSLVYTAYLVASFLSFAVVAARTPVMSLRFAAMVAVVATFLLLRGEGMWSAIAKLLQFGLTAYLIRLTITVILQNRLHLSRIEAKRYPGILGQTAVLWSPTGALAILGIGINALLGLWLVDSVYESKLVLPRPVAESETPSRNLYLDLNYTVDSRFADVEATAEALRAEAQTQLDQLPQFLPERAVQEFDRATPPPPLVSTDVCPRGGVKGVLLGGPCRMIVRAVNSSYEEYRNEKREQLRAKMLQIATDNQVEASQRVETAYAVFRQDLIETREHTKRAILYGFNTYFITTFVLNILYLLALLKSFLVILGRVAYSETYDAAFAVNAEAKPLRGKSRKLLANNPSTTLTLRKGRTKPFYMVNNTSWRGTSGDLVFPPIQPFSCFFARLANKAYLLNKLDLRTVATSPKIQVVAPTSIVALQLSPGQTIVFRFSDFLGMSEGVTIGTRFSPNISMFSLGRRFFYVSATGPGTLLLRGQGVVSAGSSSRGVSVPAERLLAFDVREQFKMDCRLDFTNIYLNQAHVVPQGYMAVTDSRDVAQSGVMRRTWELVKFLLLPW